MNARFKHYPGRIPSPDLLAGKEYLINRVIDEQLINTNFDEKLRGQNKTIRKDTLKNFDSSVILSQYLAHSREILDITCIAIRETGTFGIGARFEMIVPEKSWRRAGCLSRRRASMSTSEILCK